MHLRFDDAERGLVVACSDCGTKMRAPAAKSEAVASTTGVTASARAAVVSASPGESDITEADADWEALQSELDEGADERDGSRSRNESWTMVSRGLKGILVGVLGLFASWLAVVFGHSKLAIGIEIEMSWVAAAAALLIFLSASMCGTVPDSAARRWVWASLLTFVTGLLLVFLVGFNVLYALFERISGGGIRPAEIASAVLFTVLMLVAIAIVVFVGFTFWMMFHAAVARRLENRGLRIQSYVCIAAPVVCGVILRVAPMISPRPVRIEMAIASAVVGGLFTVWFSSVLVQTILAVDAVGKSSDK
jgi:hypothetical protein